MYLGYTLLPLEIVFEGGFLRSAAHTGHRPGLIFKSATQFGRGVLVIPDCPSEISIGRVSRKEGKRQQSHGDWLIGPDQFLSPGTAYTATLTQQRERSARGAWLEFFPCNYISTYARAPDLLLSPIMLPMWLILFDSLSLSLSKACVTAVKLNHPRNERSIYIYIYIVHSLVYSGYGFPDRFPRFSCRICRSSPPLIYFVSKKRDACLRSFSQPVIANPSRTFPPLPTCFPVSDSTFRRWFHRWTSFVTTKDFNLWQMQSL